MLQKCSVTYQVTQEPIEVHGYDLFILTCGRPDANSTEKSKDLHLCLMVYQIVNTILKENYKALKIV